MIVPKVCHLIFNYDAKFINCMFVSFFFAVAAIKRTSSPALQRCRLRVTPLATSWQMVNSTTPTESMRTSNYKFSLRKRQPWISSRLVTFNMWFIRFSIAGVLRLFKLFVIEYILYTVSTKKLFVNLFERESDAAIVSIFFYVWMNFFHRFLMFSLIFFSILTHWR